MNPGKLESLLRVTRESGSREPVSSECLDIDAILQLLDRPKEVGADALRHLTTCNYCQWAVALARRERELIEAPLSEEDAPADVTTVAAPPLRISAWLRARRAGMSIAAVVLVAVGLGWWLTSSAALLGSIDGRFEPAPVTRGEEKPKRKYAVSVDLGSQAHLTWLYVDQTRRIQLASTARKYAQKYAAGPQSFSVTLAEDEPPGPQWIAAVASRQPFNAFELRDQLQTTIDGLSKNTGFDEVIARLERGLADRTALSYRGHRFVVPVRKVP